MGRNPYHRAGFDPCPPPLIHLRCGNCPVIAQFLGFSQWLATYYSHPILPPTCPHSHPLKGTGSQAVRSISPLFTQSTAAQAWTDRDRSSAPRRSNIALTACGPSCGGPSRRGAITIRKRHRIFPLLIFFLDSIFPIWQVTCALWPGNLDNGDGIVRRLREPLRWPDPVGLERSDASSPLGPGGGTRGSSGVRHTQQAATMAPGPHLRGQEPNAASASDTRRQPVAVGPLAARAPHAAVGIRHLASFCDALRRPSRRTGYRYRHLGAGGSGIAHRHASQFDRLSRRASFEHHASPRSR